MVRFFSEYQIFLIVWEELLFTAVITVVHGIYLFRKGVRARPPKWQTKEEPSIHNSNSSDSTEHKKASSNNIKVPLITLEENYTATKISSSIRDHEGDLRPGIKNGSSSPTNVLRRRHRLPHQQHSRRLSLQDFVSEEQSIESIPEVMFYVSIIKV